MNILVIDDDINRQKAFAKKLIGHNVASAMTFQLGLDALKLNWDYVYLDHDLAEEHYQDLNGKYENTGKDLVKYIIKNKDKYQDTIFVVHTLNPSGGDYMCESLCNAGLKTYRHPFAWVDD